MGKIWLKNPDPNKQCCDCGTRYGPCSNCCKITWLTPLTGNYSPYPFISIYSGICGSLHPPPYMEYHEPRCLKCQKLAPYETFLSKPKDISDFYVPVNRPSYHDQWYGTIKQNYIYRDRRDLPPDFGTLTITDYYNNVNTIANESVHIVDGINNIQINPGTFSSQFLDSETSVTQIDQSVILGYGVNYFNPNYGRFYFTKYYYDIAYRDMDIAYQATQGISVAGLFTCYSNYTDVYTLKSTNQLEIYGYSLSSTTGGLNIVTDAIAEIQIRSVSFSCPVSVGDTFEISNLISWGYYTMFVTVSEFSEHKTSLSNWIQVENATISEQHDTIYSASIQCNQSSSNFKIKFNIGACFTFAFQPFQTVSMIVKNVHGTPINLLQRCIKDLPPITKC